MYPGEIRRDVGRINLLIASPECTSHSVAKGNGKRYESSRETAMQVVRFAKALRPRWIVVENVIQMRRWRRYQEWLGGLKGLGYKTSEVVLDSADFGVPQSRKRLFILCDRRVEPPRRVTPSRRRKKRMAGDVINKNGAYRSSPLWTRGRAKPTLTRARRAIAKLGAGRSFLLVYYGSDGAGGWQRLNVPLRTVTTLDRFAYVRRNGARVYEMRMLQVPELKPAMGFPRGFKLLHGARRDRIHLLGNAVCPPVMKAAVRTLINNG
jgi:DNA (cytosine-5)-methyltransferase 1